ncbi:sigma-70 family RNA polymerase sigma factor [Methylonatrum kenyense]|uniref:sigma-70 family RNA polymerase sigma factor n=1 Tax=Methylonatrum kenyense TaxID=455253 RepID=UPI0020BF11EC|nr:sigma-70 family RNA polymerase sigma factor [Methylonatrum kenyense]MCK8516556.1 sigma-70 family RNA polymerase sigma factor [Methylonatrum kenyense]
MGQRDELIDLLVSVSHGDQKAFERLYRQTSPRLFSVCLHVLYQRELAEEVLQEAYVRIWHRAADYHPGHGSAMAWMCSIARHRAIDVVRQRGRRPDGDDGLVELLVSADDGPMDLSAVAQENRRLADCMERLSPDQQRSIVLSFLHGFTHAELGRQLKRPLGTGKSWIRRGLESLRRCLAE